MFLHGATHTLLLGVVLEMKAATRLAGFLLAAVVGANANDLSSDPCDVVEASS